LTGEEVIPHSKLGHFSLENYGDRQVLGSNGHPKVEKRASALLPSVEALSKKQWEAITTAAKDFAFENRSDKSLSRSISAESSMEDVFVLQQSDTEDEM
jgi:hypothetical protein